MNKNEEIWENDEKRKKKKWKHEVKSEKMSEHEENERK